MTPPHALWLRTSQDSPCSTWTLSRETPACSSAKVIRPVAYPSLSVTRAVPSALFHAPTSEDRHQPPSVRCLLKTSLMINLCCSGARNPGNFAEAQRSTTRLIVDCAAYSRPR
jgi:hypothetical protein